MSIRNIYNGLTSGLLVHKVGGDTTINVLFVDYETGELQVTSSPALAEVEIYSDAGLTTLVTTVECVDVTGNKGHVTMSIDDTDASLSKGANYYLSAKLTDGSGTLSTIAIASSGAGITAHPAVTVPGGNEDATATVDVGIASVAIVSGGSSYQVSDVLTHPDDGSSASDDGTITVATVDGGGAITSVSVSNQGTYDAIVSADVNAVAFTGGSGTGFEGTVEFGLKSATITNAGTGFNSAPTPTIDIGTGTLTATITDVGVSIGINNVTLQAR